MKRFQNKVSLITGGNRGIGRAIALRLASEGSSIILFGRNEKDNQSVEKEISTTYGVPVKSYQVDMSSRKSVEEGVKEAVSHFQRIDVLINNAGICRLSTPFTEIKEEDWKETLSVNLYGVIYVTGLVIPYLEKEGGKIINIASLAGEVGGIATSADYVASKAALQGITKSLARELGVKHINVNAIAPGFVRTQMTEKMSIQLSSIPLRQVAEPEDIAAAAAFLASDDARLITGTTLDVNGGFYMN